MTEVATIPVPAPSVDWANVDWTKPSKAISSDLNVRYHVVLTKRRELGIAPGKRGRRASVSTAGFDNVDWSQSDRTVAQSLGVSTGRIGYIRKKLGIIKRVKNGNAVPATEPTPA